MDDLELYPKVDPLGALRSGLRNLRTHWKRALAYSVAVMLLLGVAGYRWVTHVTPVDRMTAVELFRAERDDSAADADAVSDVSKKQERRSGRVARGSGPLKLGVATRPGPTVAGSTNRRTPAQPQQSSTSQSGSKWEFPEEGVYSWATDGYEQVPGARRDFPTETQRIITLNGGGRWTTHHYFSREREIWTAFHWGGRGAEIAQQRNKITFGPITNDSRIDFAPPMLVGPKHLEVGYEWGGTWEGSTHGDYSSTIFEHTTMDIGGQDVDVWGMNYAINLHGKQEGKVEAKVWLAPAYALTVQEYYKQDVESDGVSYHAEWTQKLKSLHPER